MGFTSEAIFMKPAISEEEELELLEKIGLHNFVYQGQSFFEEADGRGRDSYGVYIGHCNDSTYIIFKGIIINYFHTKVNPWEKALIEIYPDKEFLSIMNYEVACGFHYSYHKDGRTIRRKSGEDIKIYFNEGEELEIEKEYYVQKEFIDGEEYFYTNSRNDQKIELERWSACQIGGEVAFKLVKMIAGVEYWHDLLFDSTVNHYRPKEAPPKVESVFQFHSIILPQPQMVSNIVDSNLQPVNIKYPIGFHPSESNISFVKSVEFSVTPDQIWEALVRVKEWDEWYPQVYNIRVIGSNASKLKIDSRFRWNTRGIHLLSQVANFEPKRVLSWASEGIGVKAFHVWQLIPTEGGTKVILEHTQKGWLCQLSHFIKPQKMEQYHLEWLNALQKLLNP